MMRKKIIDDSDSEDADFEIALEDLTNESSNLESDDTTSDIEGVLTPSAKKNVVTKIKKKKLQTLSKNSQVFGPNFVKETNEDGVEVNKEKERTDLLWKNFLDSTGEQTRTYENDSHELYRNSLMTSNTITTQDNNVDVNKVLEANLAEPSTFEKTTSTYTHCTKFQNFTQQHNNLKRKGLSNIVSTISKKSKLNTLEKSKQDWNQFKEENNLNEEITNFNRGKNGYLERQDFLQRTDSRQFEIEKELRNSGRRKTK